MLIDGGNNEDDELIVSYLRNAGVEKLDIVVGTHPHEDHIGALDAAIEAFDVDAVYMPDVSVDTATYRDVLDAVKGKDCRCSILSPVMYWILMACLWKFSGR